MTNVVFGNVFGAFRDFDRIANSMLQSVEVPGAGPDYDIVRAGEDAFELVLAVPGYSENEVNVSVEKGVLTVSGEPAEQAKEGRYYRRGIRRGRFERRFALGEHVEAKEAELKNGLLTVKLAREVPEALKPRTIAINKPAAQALPNAA